MDYEKKYKEALEKAKEYNFDGAKQVVKDIVTYIFPELKESEDERIRKMIINHLTQERGSLSNEEATEAITWLEKQGEQNLVNFEEAEKEKSDFVSGKFIQCRKSFNEFKEDNSYWLEYIGDDTYIGRSDNILNQKFHITPRQLYRLFSQEHCIKNNNEETNAPFGYGKNIQL